MKTLILNPASSFTKNVIRDVMYGCWCRGKRIGGGTVPPFALLNVATILKEDGNEIKFLDAQGEHIPFEEVGKTISDFEVVIISTSTMSFKEDAAYLRDLKDLNPNLTTIIFGSHPTFMPKYSLAEDSVDIIVRHEPEFIIRDIIRAMNSGNGEWKEVNGIGFGDKDGIKLNDPYPPFNMDDLPLLDISLLPKDTDYFNPLVKRMPYITTTTSKGCPALCTFCTAPYFDGMKVRFQSAEYIVKELQHFVDPGIKEVYFRDDTFFVKKDRDMKWCKEAIKLGLDITWIANARVSMIDKEMMEVAKEAGCHTIKFGIESGNQVILDRMRKGYTLDQAYQVFEWIHEVGIDAHAHVMLGNPGDNLETVNQTIQFVKELDPATATFGVCTPYPGTPLFTEVAQVYPEIMDGTQSDLSKLHVEGLFNEIFTSLTKEELEKSVQRAYREFYLRPKYWIKTLGRVKSKDDMKRMALAASNVVDFAIRGE